MSLDLAAARRVRAERSQAPQADADVAARRAEALVEQLAPALLAYFTRRVLPTEDAADLLSETLLVMWRTIEKVPTDDEQARMWLFGVARNVLSTHRRGRARRSALASQLRAELSTTPSWVDLDGHATEPDGPARRAADLVRQLPPPDREIFMLVHWEGFTLSQVAQLMSLPAGTVRSRCSRARSRLRRALSTPEEP